MPDLEQRMRGIDHLAVPDLWDRARIESLDHQPAIQPSPGRRVAIIAAGLAVSAAALWLLWVAFRPDLHDQPATPPISVTNGDIWVYVVGENHRDVAIYRVDPEHAGKLEAMWTDSPQVFAGARNAPELVAIDYAFSTDGTRVAFSAHTGDGGIRTPRELFVMNADGTGLRQLTSDGAYVTDPAWSPDGNTIAYTRRDHIFESTDIYVISAGGGASTPLAADPFPVNEMDPSWSPDGTRIAFTLQSNDPRGFDPLGSIVSMRPDGTDRIEVARGKVSAPAWSPDGASIAFRLKHNKTASIWTIAPDGSGARELVDTGTNDQLDGPLWSPDGSSVAFARPFGGTTSLWLMDADGATSPERVAGWPGFDGYPIAWRPVPAPSSSPTASAS